MLFVNTRYYLPFFDPSGGAIYI